MWLIPILTVLGVDWLVQNLGAPKPPASARVCPNCGKGVMPIGKTVLIVEHR